MNPLIVKSARLRLVKGGGGPRHCHFADLIGINFLLTETEKEMSKKYTGHCACGQVTYGFDTEPTLTANCHCTDCKRASGAEMTTWVVVPDTDFKVSSGSTKSFSYGPNTETCAGQGLESTEQAHMEASSVMLARADRLFAVWDRQPARGYGGHLCGIKDRGLASCRRSKATRPSPPPTASAAPG